MSGPIFMIDERDIHKGFFFRWEFAEIGKDSLSPEQYQKYLETLVEIACYGSCEVEDPCIRLCLNQVVPSIRAANGRYVRCVKQGSKGGRKRSFSDAELIKAMTELNFCTQKELAEHFGCTVRTIARRVKPSNVAEVYKRRQTLTASEDDEGGM